MVSPEHHELRIISESGVVVAAVQEVAIVPRRVPPGDAPEG